MNKLITILLLGFITGNALAQNCSQAMEEAQRAYYSGNLKTVLTSLSPCVAGGRFASSEMEDALKLLINASLILNEDSLADSYMFQLLTVSPLTDPNASDLVKFQRLYYSYDIKPKRNVGLLIGTSRPSFQTLQYRSLGSISREIDTYETKPGFILGLTYDHYLSDHLFLSSAVIYNRYSYQQEEFLLTYQQSFVEERLDYLNLPLQVGYQVSKGNFDYFISGGIAANILLSSKADLELFGIQSSNSITIIPGIPEKGQDVDLRHQRDNLVFNYLLNLGLRRRIGLIGLELTIQYDIGANNLVNSNGRFADEEVWGRYSYVPNDFKVDAMKVMFGVSRRFYKPTKTTKP